LSIRPAVLETNTAGMEASGSPARFAMGNKGPSARGLHSSTFQLNLSALHGIGGARRGCVARVEGVLEGV